MQVIVWRLRIVLTSPCLILGRLHFLRALYSSDKNYEKMSPILVNNGAGDALHKCPQLYLLRRATLIFY